MVIKKKLFFIKNIHDMIKYNNNNNIIKDIK